MKILLACLFLGCNTQNSEQQMAQNKETDSIKPQESWKVNREYDEFGNLIKYDSSYVYSYSNIEGDSIEVNLDSIMDLFQSYFKKHTPFSWKRDFFYFPESDSLLMNDFFREDYFLDHWNRQPYNMEDIFKKMDSTRNAFLKKYHPGLLESQK